MQGIPDVFKSAGRNSGNKKLNRLTYLRMQGMKGLYLFLRGHFTPHEIATYLGAYENEIWSMLEDAPVMCDPECTDERNLAGWMEFNLYMQNQLLRDSDVMGMNRGVEIRVPFLDDDNIRLAGKILPEEKYKGRFQKQLLIDAFGELLPHEIWDRPKMGFSFPFQQWLSQSDYVNTLFADQNDFFYRKFSQGKLHWSLLMVLLIIRNKKLN